MPNLHRHSQFEQSVCESLESSGFQTVSVPYHETFPNDLSKILTNRWSETALYIRSRADRVAIHLTLPIEFEFEVKTHETRRYSDITLEALPLIHHISKSKLGVRCLYVHYDPYRKRTVGFWADNLPPIREIMIPDRWSKDSAVYKRYQETFATWFPGIDINDISHRKGSGDPFVIIDSLDADKLPYWLQLVIEEVNYLIQKG